MRSFHVLPLLLGLPIGALATTLGGGGDPRPLDPGQTYDFGADPAALADTYVATQAPAKLKNVKRVAVTNFCVQFVLGKSASATSASNWSVYTRSASSGIPGGLDPAKMQAVADALLDRMEADFRAAGIEVVPYEQLQANELYRKFTAKYETGIRAGARTVESGKGGSVTEEVVYVSPRGRPFAPDCGTISPASTGTFVRMSYPLDAEFLTGSAVIDLADARAGGRFFEQAKADLRMLQYLRAGDSQYQFVGKMGPGARLWLKQSIVPATNPFAVGEARKGETTTTVDNGITTSSTTRSTETTRSVGFDEALYYDNAAKSLEAMHRLFMQRVAAR